jgi:hypothetical protein
MTEAEWLACDDPVAMWKFAREKVSDRKGRLFACACCRQVWELMTDARSRAAVEFVERHADAGPKGKRGFPALRKGAWDATEDASGVAHDSIGDRAQYYLAKAREEAARAVSRLTAVVEVGLVRKYVEDAVRWGQLSARPDARPDPTPELIAQASFLREILGSGPVRPVPVEPRWLTPDVLALARGIDEERAFDRLPILADALEDAGCDDPTILDHLRSPGPHVRGCWALDTVLGKQ